MRVGQRHRLDLVVRDVEHRRAEVLLDALELEAQVVAQLGVERRQRLVHQRDRGLAHQRAADRDALHLPARELGRRAWRACRRCAAGARPRSPCARTFGLGARPQRRAQREREVVEHAQVRVERVLLEHEGHVAQRRRGRGDVVGRRCGRWPASGCLEAGDQAQRRRLAGAARAEQDDELAARDVEDEVVDRRARRRSACRRRSRRSSAMARPAVASASSRACAARGRCWSNSETARGIEGQADVVAALARLADADLGAQRRADARWSSGDDLAVCRGIRCRAPRRAAPSASSKRTCSGRTPHSSARVGDVLAQRAARRRCAAPIAHRARARSRSAPSKGRKFIAGAPMKSATNTLRRPVVDLLRRAELLDHAAGS